MEKIIYGFYSSPIGEMVLGKTEKGLCWLGFMVKGYKGNGYERMVVHFKNVEFLQDDLAVRELGDSIINAWENDCVLDIPLDLHGTEFQRLVWNDLLAMRKGAVKTYGDISNSINKPRSARAVGTAVGSNPVSLLVPCHRIIQKSGKIGNYGWGVELKRKILQAEGVCGL